LNAYIISWLGKEKNLERVPLLHKVVNWCKSKDLQPVIIAMQWPEKLYSEFSGVSWIKSDLQMPPGHARNIGLNHFYSTDDDYCILLDDDTYIEKGDSLIDTVKAKDIGDVITVTHSDLCYYLDSFTKHHMVKGCNHIITGCFIVRNFRKRYKQELFFNTNFVADEEIGLLYGEDVNFARRAITKGYRVYEVLSSAVNEERQAKFTDTTWRKKPWDDIVPIGHKNMERLEKLENLSSSINPKVFKVKK